MSVPPTPTSSLSPRSMGRFLQFYADAGYDVEDLPAWFFAAPGSSCVASAIEANPDFFYAFPAAADPSAGVAVLLDDPNNPWRKAEPRRNPKCRRAGPEVYPPEPEVKLSSEVPWFPKCVSSKTFHRKHYVFRKGGRSNVLKHSQARKGGCAYSPDGTGFFTYGSFGPGGSFQV